VRQFGVGAVYTYIILYVPKVNNIIILSFATVIVRAIDPATVCPLHTHTAAAATCMIFSNSIRFVLRIILSQTETFTYIVDTIPVL